MTSIASSSPSLEVAARPIARWPGLIALFLGACFVLGTGFSHIDAVHNAAHDARHAAGFPCH
jgi:cobalt transporter subunit CbtB